MHCPSTNHLPSYKSCLWWGLEKLECESVTVMEVSCQIGRQVAATQGWSAPWHAKRPGPDMPCCSAGYEGRQDGVGVTRTRGCQEENTRTKCHVHHVDQAPPSLILLDWDSCEYGLCMVLMDVCVYFISEWGCVHVPCVLSTLQDILWTESRWSKIFLCIKTNIWSLNFHFLQDGSSAVLKELILRITLLAIILFMGQVKWISKHRYFILSSVSTMPEVPTVLARLIWW